jgi:hypothetical protein
MPARLHFRLRLPRLSGQENKTVFYGAREYVTDRPLNQSA